MNISEVKFIHRKFIVVKIIKKSILHKINQTKRMQAIIGRLIKNLKQKIKKNDCKKKIPLY